MSASVGHSRAPCAAYLRIDIRCGVVHERENAESFFPMPPLHRSLVFWFGLLVVAFLLTMARDSQFTERQWILALSPRSKLELSSSGALVHLNHHEIGMPAGWPSPKTEYLQKRIAATSYTTYFPAPWIGRKLGERLHISTATGPHQMYANIVRGISLPHGLLAALFVPPWILLAVRRAKRIEKLREAMEENAVAASGTKQAFRQPS